jgi:NADH:ubiquinone oxidoreductase subunit K
MQSCSWAAVNAPEGAEMKAHWVTIAFLLCAIGCYGAFLSAGVIVFFVLGVASEMVFWARTIWRIHAARVIQVTSNRLA